jgi:DNA-directed RNA polymerase specialized sigma24 family protein
MPAMHPENSHSEARGHPVVFATTHWSVVLTAGQAHYPQAAAALEQLCRSYWYPLYAFVRRQGRSPEDAQDLTQDFFAHLLSNGFPCGARPERGKFRSFLLVALRHFLVDQHRHADAAKRGGGQTLISLDVNRAEERFGEEPHDASTPEMLYQRAWGMTLLERARLRLGNEYGAAGKGGLYERLKAFPLAGKNDQSFELASAELGMSVGALKAAVHRMRSRYRELVREEVAHTVADPSELQEEARYLIAAISQ